MQAAGLGEYDSRSSRVRRKDELAPVDQDIKAIGDVVYGRVSFTAVVAPGAQHNLTIHPQPGEPFF